MSKKLPRAVQRRLDNFAGQLLQYSWFSTAGGGVRPGPRAKNLSEAHFGWWRPQRGDKHGWAEATRVLETQARESLSDAQIDLVFRLVSESLGPVLWDALGEYLDRVSADGSAPDPIREHAAAALDAHEWILRDLCWAAIECVGGEPGFFNALLPFYRAGRWPCGWVGELNDGRPVLL